MHYRHGELELTPVKEVKGRKLNHKVLAEGEATGHKHEVIGDAELYEQDGVLYLSAVEQVELVHPDHNTVTLPKGNYIIETQREYEISEKKYKLVQD